MSDAKVQDRNARIGLTRQPNRLDLKKGGEQNVVRQSFSHGRSKSVAVEVKKRRVGKPPAPGREGSDGRSEAQQNEPRLEAQQRTAKQEAQRAGRKPMVLKPLTEDEKKSRLKALSEARKVEDEARKRAEENAKRAAEENERRRVEEEAAASRKAEEDARRKVEEEARRKAEEQAARLLADEERRRADEEQKRAQATAAAEARTQAKETARTEAPQAETATPTATPASADEAEKPTDRPQAKPKKTLRAREESSEEETRGKGKVKPGKSTAPRRVEKDSRRPPKVALDGEDDETVRVRSLASLRRQRERERRAENGSTESVVREVVIPETITVQELASRMAVRGADVVKALMRSGVMATINQVIDADTAEIVVGEFGHVSKRVSEADVEEGIEGVEDASQDLVPRAPIVTVMGHVDHGKTSLLDALRKSDVAAGEAGGITQHIGAYQVDIGHGVPVTFIDTPGHAAFTSMRARGASITDIVVLVVAADDGVMPQTIEAISHARAAKVPIVVAINKIDRPEADPTRVKQELLSHEVVVEDFGGDILAVEVSAVQRSNLDKLIEAIQLQAELLDLTANPDREAQGVIIEARLDRGRGVVATLLVERGTLRMGDIVVAGAYSGRVRALIDDRGRQVKEAGPATPVELLGLDGVPDAGDRLAVVENEKRGRDIADYRQRKLREQQVASGAAANRTSLEDMFSQLKTGELTELPVVIKTDVHGSLEAIQAGLEKLGGDLASVRVLYGGVGGITESDVTLAQASKAMIIGFNVRANAQARELARREGLEIRYYSIIYELLDDVKGLLEGLLSPVSRENILGHAEIREVFNITKIGKVAGCRVIDGVVRRNARSRLLRDDVVVFEGMLGSLRRFKDDVREVREGFECGMSIEGYNDIRQGDVIEVFELEEVARTLS